MRTVIRRSADNPPITLRRSITLVASGEETGGVFSLTEHAVPPGFGPRLHVHRVTDEADYVLEGQVTFQVGDERVAVDAGGFVLIPRGTAHAWANLRETHARLLMLFSPPGVEGLWNERFRKVWQQALATGTEPDSETLNRLTKDYDTEIIGQALT